jgi:hypothetical protein
VALFGALAMAANFTAALLIVSEAAWLAVAVLLRRGGGRDRPAGALHLLGPALALGAGVVLLVPFSIAAGHAALGALRYGALAWARLRPPWWPFELLRRASGKAPFLLSTPRGGWGAAAAGRRWAFYSAGCWCRRCW